MDDKALLTKEDCLKDGYDMPITGKVIVLNPSVLPEEHQSADRQLYFCTGGNGSNSNPIGRSVFCVSLADGEQVRWNRSDILGIARPEVLSEKACLQLSQIRPMGALDLKGNDPQYSGYCFLPDGRYTSGVWLCSTEEVQDYIEMQMDYQHRVMICDRNDFCVFEMQEGKLLYPTEEMLKAHRGEQELGGMDLKL